MSNFNEITDYRPDDLTKLSIESQFTLEKICINARKMSHVDLFKYFINMMILFFRLKAETNKLLVIVEEQKKLIKVASIICENDLNRAKQEIK